MKVYIPTMEELIELQKLGIDVYSYLVTKVTETIIMEDKVYDEGDMFEILDYLGPHPEIVYAICKLYPQKIGESIITSKDPNLCNKLISTIKKEDKTIYGLDDILMKFDESILFDKEIIKNVVNFLSYHLSQCPKYRFDYMGPNILLDSIFSCELPKEKITSDSYVGLTTIDPIYCIKLGLTFNKRKNENLNYLIQRGMLIYLNRYGLDQYNLPNYNQLDIINKPDDNIKRLIKCLEYHKKNYQ